MQETFTSRTVVDLTGISPRQLQWWDERGIVSPARQGHRRLYSLADLAEVSVICELRRKGFSLQGVRKVLRFLDRELGKRLVETLSSGADVHLLTDGKRIYLENSARQVVDVLKNSRQPILSICLSDAVRRVRTDVRADVRQNVRAGVRQNLRPDIRRKKRAANVGPPRSRGRTA